MNKFLWLIAAALAILVIVAGTGLLAHGTAGSISAGTVPPGVPGVPLAAQNTSIIPEYYAAESAAQANDPGNLGDPIASLALQTGNTASHTADGQNASGSAVDENLKTLQFQGIAPPCEDIQKNCNISGPVAAETYTQAELIAANTVSVEAARQQAQIALAEFTGSNASGKDRCLNATITGNPVSLYSLNGTKLYYLFSASSRNGTCNVFVKANKLLGSPLFLVRSDRDLVDNLAEQTHFAEKTVRDDYPGYLMVSSRIVYLPDFHEGMQFVMNNPTTNETIQPVLDLITLLDVTENATAPFVAVTDTGYASRMGEYQHQLSDWEMENMTISGAVNP